jgi:hypothetical protein
MVEEATGEAVSTYFQQSFDSSTNMVRACLAMTGANPDDYFPVKAV